MLVLFGAAGHAHDGGPGPPASTTTSVTTLGSTTSVPPPTASTSPAGCHPSYVGTCIPVASDVDCPVAGDGPEFAATMNFTVVGPDVYGLDTDGDGVACEGQPGPAERAPARGPPVEQLDPSRGGRFGPTQATTAGRIVATGAPTDRQATMAGILVCVGLVLLVLAAVERRNHRRML